jgi:MFS transporter, OFA family, oxalate/formate antiporter
MSDRRRESFIFYGWYIVLVSLISRFMSTGVGFYVFNAFMDPLCKQRGWSRLDINLAPMLGNAVGVANMFVFGTLVMLIGPRKLMTIGPIISGIAFMSLGQAQSLWQFYTLFILMIVGNGAMAGIVSDTVITRWFDRNRGKAIGLSTVGVSLSGAVLPLTATVIIERSDLAHAFGWIGAAIVAIAPVSWAIIRDAPEHRGLIPDGIAVLPGGSLISAAVFPSEAEDLKKKSEGDPGASGDSWTLRRALTCAAFWKLSAGYALAMMGVTGVMFQLAPRFQDLGYGRRDAMLMMSATALVGAAGKYLWGALCDRYRPRRVVTALMVCAALGLSFGLIKTSLPALLLFAGIYGFSMGGVVSTSPIMIAEVFGREVYASIARFVSAAINFYFVSYLVMGWTFEQTGSYDAAYILFILLYLIAAWLIGSIKPVRKQRYPVTHRTGLGALRTRRTDRDCAVGAVDGQLRRDKNGAMAWFSGSLRSD